MARRSGIGVLLLALCGCPGGSQPGPPGPALPRGDATQPAAEPTPPRAEPTPPAPTATPPERETMTRSELLSLEPADLFADGLRGDGPHGLAAGLAGTGALALAEQARDAGSPREALALASVIFRRAAENTASGQQAPEGVLAKLDRDIEVQAGDQPRLQAWLLALRDVCRAQEDYAAASAFLGQAHLTWGSVDVTRDLEQD